ncbi:MAG TPA: DapH/DapD/GlmU-related protein [bacterium]|nr:DapH/DapD/GlmU-related protein [bacterium]HPN44906.1 DapH/DapD/GlmU-related protein [bacterium]
MTFTQQVTEILRWMAVYCPHPGLRTILFRKCGVKIGEKVVINFGVNIIIPMSEKGVIKDNIVIGDRVAIATGVVIVGQSDPNFSVLAKLYPEDNRPIHIGNDVWLGANVVILPGVTIGDRSIVAAGAVVTRDVPPDTVVGGVPAVKIKDIPKIN